MHYYGSIECFIIFNTIIIMLCLHSVLLFINIATPTVNVSLLDGSFTANKFFQLKCDVTGSPTALIRWKKIVGPPVEEDYIISNEVFVLIIIQLHQERMSRSVKHPRK